MIFGQTPTNETIDKMSTKTKSKSVPMIVTTAHKGVFFGYGVPSSNKTVRITEARMAVYWSSDVKGVVGLASKGPSNGCKIGPAAPAITLQDVTSVMEVSKEAEAKWKEEPWN